MALQCLGRCIVMELEEVNTVTTHIYRSSCGQSTVLYTANKLWNALPMALQSITILDAFKRGVKRVLITEEPGMLYII